MTTCEWRRGSCIFTWLNTIVAHGDLSLLTSDTSSSVMTNFDANSGKLQLGADLAFDRAAFIGEEDSENHVIDAESSAEMTAQEDRDAERTDSHEQPSKCTRSPMGSRLRHN